MSGRIVLDPAPDNPTPADVRGPDNPAKIRPGIDLVTAARRHLSFLRSLSSSALLPSPRSIQRYEKLWMPLIADLVASSTIILPPADVRWIWLCHCLHDPAGYRNYCESRFGMAIEQPEIFDEENEDYAILRCLEIWSERYPSEPFELEGDDNGDVGIKGEVEIFSAVAEYQSLVACFADSYVLEKVYLVSAKQRYLDFLHLVTKYGDKGMKLVPASDVLLMWLTHMSFPVTYTKDLDPFEDLDKKVVRFGNQASEKELIETRRIWEEAFDEPYEKPGALFNPQRSPSRFFINWEASGADVNRVYKVLQPRFSMEVYLYIKGKCEKADGGSKRFLRLKTVRSHKMFKLDKPLSDLPSETWQKTWHLYCEFSTIGILLEVREKRGSCFSGSKLLNTASFSWNDLLRATTFTLTRDVEISVRAAASITPPVQAPYLLKCVPDRVTDDTGAMVSEVILRMNNYHPQEGRWLTRTVLNHNGKECFVVRIRVGTGIWRRGAENPRAVKWEERIIELRQGGWSYVVGSVGYAPEKVVGTATPKREGPEDRAKCTWCLSTGDVLRIQWQNGPEFYLENENSPDLVRLIGGRKLQYELKKEGPAKATDQEEQHYVTLARFSPEYPDGRATALINWKLLAVEFLPEEDAVLILLLCMAIARTVSEFTREDVAGLLVRSRRREVEHGVHDWGSVILPSTSPPHLQPWYWNAKEVLAPAKQRDGSDALAATRYPPVEGKDALYRESIIP